MSAAGGCSCLSAVEFQNLLERIAKFVQQFVTGVPL